MRTLRALVLGIAFLVAPLAVAAPTKAVPLGKPFTLQSGQQARLGALKVRVIADHRPIERGPGGVEQFPFTYYRFEWEEGADKLVIPMATPSSSDQQFNREGELFGRYTFTFERGASDDEVVLTVFKRSCLLRYTSSNQLQHADGKIIFDSTEDWCCYYSDGKNNCDPKVRRAQQQGSGVRYCVLYSGQKRSAEERCCCRFEKGEALDKECQPECERLMKK
jgi:hypothetical protein